MPAITDARHYEMRSKQRLIGPLDVAADAKNSSPLTSADLAEAWGVFGESWESGVKSVERRASSVERRASSVERITLFGRCVGGRKSLRCVAGAFTEGRLPPKLATRRRQRNMDSDYDAPTTSRSSGSVSSRSGGDWYEGEGWVAFAGIM